MEKYSKVYIKLSPFAHLSQSIYVYFMWQNIHTFISNCSNYLPLFIYYSPFMRNKYISCGKIYFFQIISLIHLLHKPIIEKSIGLSKNFQIISLYLSAIFIISGSSSTDSPDIVGCLLSSAISAAHISLISSMNIRP